MRFLRSMLAGIPARLREMLESAPEEQRMLLELRLRWPELDDVRARIAARLRVFLLTWDPLDWHDWPPARATAIGEGDDYEVLLYVPLEQTIATAAATGEEIAVVLGDLAASVLDVGAAHERALTAGSYSRLAFAGKAPSLLSRIGTLSGL